MTGCKSHVITRHKERRNRHQPSHDATFNPGKPMQCFWQACPVPGLAWSVFNVVEYRFQVPVVRYDERFEAMSAASNNSPTQRQAWST